MFKMSIDHFGDLRAEEAVLFVCDIQEKFKPHIAYFDSVVEGAKRLINAAQLLHIPYIVTEQYPNGLGSTVSDLDKSKAAGVFSKTKFSMVTDKVEPVLDNMSKKAVILCGLETHVCIQQTTIDLLKKGVTVYIAADACSSRSQMDRWFALERLRQAGAIVSTTESLILQLVRDKDHDKFKEAQKLIMQSMPCSFANL